MSTPVNVTVTGAAGQIGYALLFRIASGHLLGADVPVKLRLLEIPQAPQGRRGHRHGARRLRLPAAAGIDITDDPNVAFDGANVALLVGARPRTKGMERGDLLAANGGIFKPQGKAINDHAADDIKVLVVGNPANTNALIAQAAAPDVPAERFTAMTRLDHNRALSQLAKKTGVAGLRHQEADHLGQPLGHPVPGHLPRGGRAARTPPRSSTTSWLADDFIPTVAKRGAAIIEARGASSAASAANAAIDHVHTWVNGTADGDWTSMAVSDGSYGIEEGSLSLATRVSAPVATTWIYVEGPRSARALCAGADRRPRGRGAALRARGGRRASDFSRVGLTMLTTGAVVHTRRLLPHLQLTAPRIRTLLLALALFGALGTPRSLAFPDRPVRIIVPYAPGGGN